jgi:hypothetical protein
MIPRATVNERIAVEVIDPESGAVDIEPINTATCFYQLTPFSHGCDCVSHEN